MNGCQSTASRIISTFKMLFMFIFSFRAVFLKLVGSSSGLLLFVQAEEDTFCCIIKIGTPRIFEEEHYHHFFNLCNSCSTLGLFVVNKLNLTRGRGGLAGRKQFPTFCENPKWGAPFSFFVFISVFHAIFAPTSNAKKINR